MDSPTEKPVVGQNEHARPSPKQHRGGVDGAGMSLESFDHLDKKAILRKACA